MADDASSGKLQRAFQASQVFTPSAPVQKSSLFAGRRQQLHALFGVLGQRGLHAILYGERSVGKTSIANVLAELWESQSSSVVKTYRVNCAAEHTFKALWHTIFRRMDLDVPEHEVTPDRVVEILDERHDVPLIIIDELDRFDDNDGLTSLADTIKALSDHSVMASIVLVGVAGSITELVGDHRSIERCLLQVHMPRMSLPELERIIDLGLAELKMTMDAEARSRIARLSQGLPSYTHLLARDSCVWAIQSDRSNVTEADLAQVILNIATKGQFSVLRDYTVATSSPRQKHLFHEVLLACALAPKDALGYFTPKAVAAPLARILKRPVRISAYMSHLKDFTTSEHSSVLEVDGQPRKYRFRFIDPMMQPFIIMRGLANGTVALADITLGTPAEAKPNVPDRLPDGGL